MKMLDDSAIRKASPRLLETLQYTRRRRVMTYGNFAVMMALLLGIVVMVNLIARDHSGRFNWTADRVEELSPATVQRIRAVTGEIDIYVNAMTENRADRSLPEAWRLVQLMLLEFARQNPNHIRVVAAQEDRIPPKWMQEFGPPSPDSIYIRHEDENKVVSSRIFHIRDLYDGNPQTGEITDLKAELNLVSAIWTLANSKEKVLYFVEGHDEVRVQDQYQGATMLLGFLKQCDNVESKALDLGLQKRVPRDADAVFVAGPRKDFPVAHLDALGEYLEGGGRLMVAVDPSAGTPQLRKFLEGWGARVGTGIVWDKSCVNRWDYVRVPSAGIHPISFGLSLPDRHIDVPSTTTVTPVAPPERKAAGKSLLTSSEESFEDANGDGRPGTDEAHSNLSLAVAIEGEPVKKPRDPQRPVPKIVVWGSVKAFTNDNARPDENPWGMAYHLDNFRWLLELEQVITPPQKRQIKMTPVDLGRRGRQQIAWISVGLMPLMGVILGILAWWFRRK